MTTPGRLLLLCVSIRKLAYSICISFSQWTVRLSGHSSGSQDNGPTHRLLFSQRVCPFNVHQGKSRLPQVWGCWTLLVQTFTALSLIFGDGEHLVRSHRGACLCGSAVGLSLPLTISDKKTAAASESPCQHYSPHFAWDTRQMDYRNDNSEHLLSWTSFPAAFTAES